MRDWAHSRRLGTPADEAGYVVLRQPPASKLANLFRMETRGNPNFSSLQPVGQAGGWSEPAATASAGWVWPAAAPMPIAVASGRWAGPAPGAIDVPAGPGSGDCQSRLISSAQRLSSGTV